MPRLLVASLVLLVLSPAFAAYLDVSDPPSLRQLIAEKAVDNQLILFVYARNGGYGTAWRDMTTQLAFSLERVGYPNYVVVALDAAACDELRAATPLVTPTCVTNSILHRTHGYSNAEIGNLWVIRVRDNCEGDPSRRTSRRIISPAPPLFCADACSVRSTTRPLSSPALGVARLCSTQTPLSHARSCPFLPSCRKRARSFIFTMRLSSRAGILNERTTNSYA